MTVLREPRGADAVRLVYSDAARRLSDVARRLVPTSRDHGRGDGDYLHEALLALKEVERLIVLAVAVERAQGTTWDAIGEAGGRITKQSAQKKWEQATAVVDQLSDGLDPDLLRSLHASSPMQLAEDLDAWYVRHVQPGDLDVGVTAADRPVSGYLVDPGPAPDLSQYDTLPDDAYEWYLSDHPWARAERIRRIDAARTAELRNASDVRDWTDRIDGLDLQARYPRDRDIAENLRGLAALMRPIADQQQLRAHLAGAEPDEVSVRRLREDWVTRQQVEGNDTYHYPTHLTGPGAGAYPPPVSGFPAGAGESA